MGKGRIAVFLLAVLCVCDAVPIPSAAQNASVQGAPAAAPAYSAANEVTLQGAITEVVAHPAPGMPLGAHVMLATSQGTVDAHLGPYAAKSTDFAALTPGATVQVTGVMTHFAAGDVLLARAVTVGNRAITIRNAHGFLLRQGSAAGAQARASRQRGGQS